MNMPSLALTLQRSRGHLETEIFKPSVLVVVISPKIQKGMFLSSCHLQHCWGCVRTGGQWPTLYQLAGSSVLPPVQPDEEGMCEQSLSSAPLRQPLFQLGTSTPNILCASELFVYIQTLKLRPTTIFSFLEGTVSRPAFSPS